MEKKLFFQFSDNGDISKIVMKLDACMEWIKGDDLEKVSEEDLADFEYTLKPVLMTEEEYENLPEANI